MTQHCYNPDEMARAMAGEDYSSANGAWVTGEKIIFGEIHMPAGTHADAHGHQHAHAAHLAHAHADNSAHAHTGPGGTAGHGRLRISRG